MTLFDSSTEAAISSLQTMIDRVQVGQQRLRDQDDRFSRRYRDNMNLFAAVMPHIYDEFKDYQPKNRAVFVEACSDLNLYDASQNLTLFTREPRKRAHVQFEQFKSKPLKTFLTFGRQQVHPSRHVHFGNQYVEKWYEAQEAYPEKSPLPHFVPSMVMFGLEFGYQLECLLAGHEVKHLYIYEPELDFFYYSLFAIDWQPILEHFNCDGRTINFLLGVQAKDITDKYLVQLEENGFFWAPETYIYIAYKTPTLDESVRAFQSSYARQASGWGFFDDALIGIAQGMRSLPNMTLCVMNSEKKLPRWQQDIPVFILGNGPSLDDGVELLKEVRDQVILISCGSTINTLRRMGIKPDFQVDVERMKQTVDKFVFFEKQELSDVVGLTVDVMHPDFYQYFDSNDHGRQTR